MSHEQTVDAGRPCTGHSEQAKRFRDAGAFGAGTRVEGLEPPIAGFVAKNSAGGIHHVCYEVDDLIAARDQLKSTGARVLGDGEPKIGAHGKPVLFLHPKDFCGTLVELEQA